MKFLILGPLVIRSGDREVVISAPRQRIVLTMLLLNPNKVVSVDRIAQFVWDDPLPRSAAATVRTYVMRLRRVLDSFGADQIQTHAPGYLVRVQEGDTDLGSFHSHRRTAKTRAESGDLAGAVEELDRGLGLWRSDPFVDLPCSRLHEAEGDHLRELRLQTLGWRVDMQLELQRHAEILPELRRVVREQPLNEAFVGRLMLALFRSGQQPEALGLFQRVRADLIAQFGMEPGADLRKIQSRILRGEDEPLALGPVTVRGEAGPAADGAEPTLPAQLPPQVRDFTGRTGQTRALRALLTARTDARQAVATAIVTGPAGIGKTSLLLRVAHDASADFPEGQLYASLEGPQGTSVDPAQVARRFLVGLGIPRTAIPDGDDDLLDLYRSVVARRKVLIVLDDVCHAGQVRPLTPGSGDSRILVSSRRHLTDLDGAGTVVLDPLDEQDATDLLAGIVGRPRIEAEAEAVRVIVRACDGLPLALRIAGRRLLHRPGTSVAETARKLADAQRSLDELQFGDLAVRSALDRMYDALGQHSRNGDDLRKTFRWLGLITSRQIRTHAVAVLLECSERRAEELLDELAEVHLVRGQGAGRYSIDHLSWSFACERLHQEEMSGYYIAALQRMNRHGYVTDVPFVPSSRLPV